jgi:hypothetical protein
MLCGCGNVQLSGTAMTAAEKSTMDAYQSVQRYTAATSRPAGEPTWTAAYLTENFRQWRWFVRAAKRDMSWGPKLPGEGGAQ